LLFDIFSIITSLNSIIFSSCFVSLSSEFESIQNALNTPSFDEVINQLVQKLLLIKFSNNFFETKSSLFSVNSSFIAPASATKSQYIHQIVDVMFAPISLTNAGVDIAKSIEISFRVNSSYVFLLDILLINSFQNLSTESFLLTNS
jgi:hypothetical protein